MVESVFSGSSINIVVKFGIKESSVVQTMAKSEKEPFVTFTGGYVEMQDIETAIQFASNYSKIFICGGRSVYKYCLENNLIDTIYLTEVSSENLEEQINQNPDKYIRFPLDIKKYVKKWDYDEIFYDPAVLPSEDNDIMVKFMKYTKNK